jgi:hypothetical protein
MNALAELSDKRLLKDLERLKHDIQDFEQRASLQKTILERQERFSPSEPLYQRLTSIRDHLRADLQRTQEELERRRRTGAAQPRASLRSAIAALLGVRR